MNTSKKLKLFSIFCVLFAIVFWFYPNSFSASCETRNKYCVIFSKLEAYETIEDMTAVKQLSLGDHVYVESDFEIVSNGVLFAKVYENEISAQCYYVLRAGIVLCSDDIVNIPTKNATIFKTTKIYNSVDNVYKEGDIILQPNTRVSLYSKYNSSAPYQYIAFEYEESVIYGYVPTSTIEPDGISPYFITAITISIALVGIILAILFIKKKN